MEPTENYRPISLLCIISKVLLNNSSVLSSMAFCEIASALHSCYLLMPLVKTWTKYSNRSYLLDLAKAFDSVDH